MALFSTLRRNALWYFLAALILAAGVGGFRVMGALKTPVLAEPSVREVPIVTVSTAAAVTQALPIRGDGFIRPFRQVAVSALSGGQIVELNPAVEQRQRVKRGDLLAQLDDRAARANLARANADLSGNQANLALLEKQLERTQRLFNQGSVSQNQLDQLESQVTQVKSAITSLQAAVQSAQVTLDNTQIRAPFDGRVLEQSADLGAVVGAGQPVVTLFTDEVMEVALSLNEAEADLIPGLMAGARPDATVSWTQGEQVVSYPAQVQRVTPAISATTRTLALTVRLKNTDARVLSNRYVNVVIDGAAPANTVAIPSTALRVDDQVWTNEDGQLGIHPVTVIHRDQETLFVRHPDLAGRSVIVSSLDGASEGMNIRTAAAQLSQAN
ncbi:MAG: efflux RND transporter periplasmic adaptor subunit [Litorivicinus sp.]